MGCLNTCACQCNQATCGCHERKQTFVPDRNIQWEKPTVTTDKETQR